MNSKYLQVLLLLSALAIPACREAPRSGPVAEDVRQRTPKETVVEFQIDDPEWDEPSPYVSLENPEPDIRNMKRPDEVVLAATKVTLVLDYPLSGEWKFPVKSQSPKGFTRADLARSISNTYKAVYAEEERTTQIKVVPLDQRTGLINRNKTNGKYGIWGHDLGDLVLHTVEVTKRADGTLVAHLGIDS